MKNLSHRTALLGFTLALSCLNYADNFPKPMFNQARFTTIVKEVDQNRKLITASTETVIQIDGTELFFGTPQEHVFSIEPVTPIHYLNNPSRWISMRELKIGTALAIYGRPNGNSIIADKILVNATDPKTIKQTTVFPPELNPIEYDKVNLDQVVVPMIYPIAGKSNYSDTFLASRGGGTRRHKGQDLMAAKLTPAIACFDGTVELGIGLGNAGNTITLVGDNGWTAEYYHMNNDSPGTDDGKGTDLYSFAPGLKTGDRVMAGQLIGWVGDSGNAEGTGPHIHFEIWSQVTGACYNAYPSLRAAKKLEVPTVFAPAPDLDIPQGHGRYEGVIRKVDRDRNVLIVDLIATDLQHKGLQSVKKPTTEYLIVGSQAQLKVFGMPDGLTLQNLLPGDRITTIAKLTPPGKGQELKELFALRNLNAQMTAQIQPQTNTQTNSLQEQGTILFGPQDSFLEKLPQSLLEKVNSTRLQRNQSPLAFNIQLARAAQEWTVNMIDGDFFDLKDERINQSLTQFVEKTTGTKNVVGFIFNQSNQTQLVDHLLKHHESDLLNPKSKSIGLGHTYIDDDPGRITYKNYWVLLIEEE